MLIRDIIARMRHDGCGGRAGKAELFEGASSRPVRKIALLLGVVLVVRGLLLAATPAQAASHTGRGRTDLHRPERTEGLRYPPKNNVDRGGNVPRCTTRPGQGDAVTSCR